MTEKKQSTGEKDAAKQRTRCEVWTRVMGYHRPVSHYNVGKKSEHMSRKHFEECVAANKQFIKQHSERRKVSVGSIA